MTKPARPQTGNGMVSHDRLSAMGEGLTLYAIGNNGNEICIRRESL